MSGENGSSGYLRDRRSVGAIFAAFPLLALPLAAVHFSDLSPDRRSLIYDLYVCFFGVTHYLLTFTVYLQSENLSHYRQTLRNRTVYLYAPIAIFVFFPLFFGSELAPAHPLLAGLVLLIVRFANYRHLTRQAYDVRQMLGRAYEVRLPRWHALAEYAFLWILALMMFLTFVYGGELSLGPAPIRVMALAGAAAGVIVVFGYVSASAEHHRPAALLVPAAYLLLQTASISLAIYRSDLYIATVAMHYVEYHVLMIPRCFDARLDRERLPDRVFAAIRSNRAAFYGGLVAIALAFLAARKVTEAAGGPMTFYMFDALFAFHYFIESYIWRFQVPHYDRTLSPLYFARA